MTSIWTSKIYYMFGFLFLCYVLMIITSASATVLLVYFLLCAEDYRWQWRAFIGAGMTGGYVFLNAIIFWISRISFGGLTGAVLYLGYSALLSFLVFLLTGECFYCVYNDDILTIQGRLASLQAGHLYKRYTVLSRWTSLEARDIGEQW